MSGCNLDGINMYCWTHGRDIDEADYVEGVCGIGAFEEEGWDEDDGCPVDDPDCMGDNGDCHDACEAPSLRPQPTPPSAVD